MPTITLATYLTQTRRLLHDSSASFWTDTNLTDYINDARYWTAFYTSAIRSLQTTFVLTIGQDTYSYTVLPTQQVIDIIGVTVIYSNARQPLHYRPYSVLTQLVRPYLNWTQLPAVWAQYGQNSFVIGPAPDQAYATEFDTVLAPNTLIDSTTVEQLVFPYTEPVPYWAAKLAKLEKQSFEEAKVFEQLFFDACRRVVGVSFTMRRRNASGGN